MRKVPADRTQDTLAFRLRDLGRCGPEFGL